MVVLGGVADTSGVQPPYVQTDWSNPPTESRTYIDTDSGICKKRNVPWQALAPKTRYDPIYPNYERLDRLNKGLRLWKWENKKKLHLDDDWRLAHAILCHLEMTNYQKQRFHHLFWKLDRQKIGLDTWKVVFGVSMLVCWEDGRRTHPLQKPWDDLFVELANHEKLLTPKPISLFNRLKDLLSDWLKDATHRRRPPKPLRNPHPQPDFRRNAGDDQNPTAA